MRKAKRVMKGEELEFIGQLVYPRLVSPKLDGIRAIKQGGILLSASMKPIRNKFVQERFKDVPDGFDGELILGKPTDPLVYRKTNSAVMTIKGEPDVDFYVFDFFAPGIPFKDRLSMVVKLMMDMENTHVKLVRHDICTSGQILESMYLDFLDQGYEGIVIRDIYGPYKEGRSTVKQGWLFKKKPFKESEAVIESWYKLKTNQNEGFINEEGLLERSMASEGMVEVDLVGGLVVRDLYTNIEFRVGVLDDESHQQLWDMRDELKGKIIKYKYFLIGGYDLPRHPTYIGFRDPIDITR